MRTPHPVFVKDLEEGKNLVQASALPLLPTIGMMSRNVQGDIKMFP